MKLIFAIFSVFFFNSCYVITAINHRNYKLKDIDDFPSETFVKSTQPKAFKRSTSINTIEKMYLDSFFIGSNIYSYLIIRNDSIIYEYYKNGLNESTKLPSFSVAKSFVSTLMEIARMEGKIKSYDESILNYLPELKNNDKRFERVTIQNVLDMRSGIKSNEEYGNMMSDVLRLGFGKNIRKKMNKIKLEKNPTFEFEYKSANTQLLSMILEKATGVKIQDYFKDKLFTPLGMEYDATWTIDDTKHKEIKAFCCLNMATRDFAKLGRLYLNKGKVGDLQLIDSSWVQLLSNADTIKSYDGYKNQWWANPVKIMFKDSISATNYYNLSKNNSQLYLSNNKLIPNQVHQYNGNYEAIGILGQSIFISPEKKIIIVKLRNTLEKNNPLKLNGYQEIYKITGIQNFIQK